MGDSLVIRSAAPARSLVDPWNRNAILADYYQNYLGSAVSDNELNWTGNLASCIPGTISQVAQNRTIQRINYYRRLVGLPDNMTFDPSRNTETQAAALIMGANNQLNHTPPSTSLCYSSAGLSGASNSNLGLGFHSSRAVKQYIDDRTPGNEEVGHRRWILYSRATSFGHGSARTSNPNFVTFADALWIANPTTTPASLPQYIAFPPAGYVPRTLIPDRWSFSIPGANFSSANVTLQDGLGAPLSLTTHTPGGAYGDNTLVWNLPATDLAWTGSADKSFRVTVSNVIQNGVTQPPYSYTVVAIDPSTVTSCPGTSPVASCSVTVSGGQSVFYGTAAFRFNTIDTQSSSASNDGQNYTDLSCVTQTTVTAGSSYTLNLQGAASNVHRLRVWIDYNGNGQFTDSGEQVVASSAGSVSAVVTIPTTASVNTLLRIRVMADAPSSATTACALTDGGQVDDYGLWIQSSTPPCTVMTTVQNGNWTSPATWSCNRAPLATDQVRIGHSITVGAGATVQVAKVTYLNGGRLSLLSSARLKLIP
ncbi:CAP domain-containing protein [Spirosoma sp. BT702]|uniref:CAP domain-containing protein n=2 Tax=Spirosoma profusum TaxID=2771354 RepID=A0A927AQB7_9BACT|nr:CAP domain-containing protein [Spirosoma profusum]